MFENQQFVELKSQQDGFDIDSLTVSCRNCPWGVTFNATKDRSLKAVSSEYLECSKTVTAPLVVTSVGSPLPPTYLYDICLLILALFIVKITQPPQFLLQALKRISTVFTER